MVIIDSCHAQGMATSKNYTGNNKLSPIPKDFTQTSLPKTIINDLKGRGRGRVVFTSSTGTEPFWIRSDRGSIAERNSVINVVGDNNSFGNITK